jgi:hypothetical protein
MGYKWGAIIRIHKHKESLAEIVLKKKHSVTKKIPSQKMKFFKGIFFIKVFIILNKQAKGLWKAFPNTPGAAYLV